jgi:hypothetical protein
MCSLQDGYIVSSHFFLLFIEIQRQLLDYIFKLYYDVKLCPYILFYSFGAGIEVAVTKGKPLINTIIPANIFLSTALAIIRLYLLRVINVNATPITAELSQSALQYIITLCIITPSRTKTHSISFSMQDAVNTLEH